MTEENVGKSEEPKETILTWRIENAHLFWQKTGEELVSPTFTIDWLNESSWNLCVYPRGIEGVEGYMSYFIAQKEKNDIVGNTGAKFELYLLAADGSKVLPEISEGFFSISKNSMFGYPRFISRKTLMDDDEFYYLPDYTITLCCRIWCKYERDMEKKEKPVKSKTFARTRIRKEDVVQQMTILLTEEGDKKIGELKPILQEHPIAQFIANFNGNNEIYTFETSSDEYLTIYIKVDNKKAEKIKSALVELVLVDENREILFWKNKYDWHEIIERENIVLSSHISKNSEDYVPEKTFHESCLRLACRFAFTTGLITQKIEKDDYGNNLDRFFEQRLSDSTNIKLEQSCQTVSDALKSLFYDPLFYDVIIKGKTAEFKVHEMILAPRSEVFKNWLSERDKTTNIVKVKNEDDNTLQNVIYFLYTDTILDMNWETAKRLYKAAFKYKIELLKEKCRAYIKKNLRVSNVSEIAVLTRNEEEDNLKEYIKHFIIRNETDVFNSIEWGIFSKSNPVLAGEYMMAKYKMK